jgi:hypothetical protein
MLSRILKFEQSATRLLIQQNVRAASSKNTNRDNETGGTVLPRKDSVQGKFKNPIVDKLWAARQEARAMMGLTVSTSSVTDVTKAAAAELREGKVDERNKGDGASGKTPAESMQSISYPFSTDDFLLETYRNPWGQMRFGKVRSLRSYIHQPVVIEHEVGILRTCTNTKDTL